MARKQLRLGSMAEAVWLGANPAQCRRIALCSVAALVIGAATLTDVAAQTARTSRDKPFPVALPPFSLDEPARYAYGAPRAVPRAEATTEADEPEPPPARRTSTVGPTVRGKRAV